MPSGISICGPIPIAYSHHSLESFLQINLVGQCFLFIVHAFDLDPCRGTQVNLLVQLPNWLRLGIEQIHMLQAKPHRIRCAFCLIIYNQWPASSLAPQMPHQSNKTRCSLDLFSV